MSRPTSRYARLFGDVGLVAGGAVEAISISRSTSSTAAIGYIFLPVTAFLFWAVPAALAGFCVGCLQSKSRMQKGIAGATLGVLVVTAAFFLGRGIYLSVEVRRVAVMDPSALQTTLNSRFLGKNVFVLGAVAQNPQATPELLHQIATRSDPELHQAMGSSFDLLGANTKGLAVMRLVASHPHVAAKTLEWLARSPEEYVRDDVARNPNTAPEDLLLLSLDVNSDVRRHVALNPRTPNKALLKLRHDVSGEVRVYAEQRLAGVSSH